MDNNSPSAEGSSGMASAAAESDDSGEGEDESSSSSFEVHATLQQFREQWQQELETSPSRRQLNDQHFGATNRDECEASLVAKAKHLFLQGVRAEQKGCLYEAIQLYRRAIQLVPDIEFRAGDVPQPKRERTVSECSQDSDRHQHKNDTDEDDVADIQDLNVRFQRLLVKKESICQPEFEQKMVHISTLPMELILYVFKWVVSAELDLQSLEQLSSVCRGFYVCARDAELWRLACIRVWGIHVGSPNKYGSWRDMFVQRPRLRFNGAYISKTTYVRHGENSFQDQFYRPWHLVEYFRYLRFFPDGVVLMLTTPDDPYSSLAKLRYRRPKHNAVLVGHYRLHGTSVVAILKRPRQHDPSTIYSRFKRHHQNKNYDAGDKTFHMELEIKEYKQKLNYQLIWRHYAVHTVYNRSGNESVSEFDLVQGQFPPFWFSQVKSYACESESPLE